MILQKIAQFVPFVEWYHNLDIKFLQDNLTVIADDHPVVPKGLKEIISESFDNAPCRQNLNTRILLKKVRII